jgi:aryl-alcohol dehydrogenase-like predicted oxidoreductase
MPFMTLPTRPLGTSGLTLTTVGFGAWAAGGGGWSFGWGPQDDSASIAAMRHAIEEGVNWIDTAAVYGLGHSEEVVGQFLRTLAPGDRPYVFTKCGLEWDPEDRMKVSRRILQPESIRRECEASLRRLGVERIDLYQFHWPDEGGVPIEDSWDAMTRLVEQGKIRAAGVSNFSVELLERCEARRHVDSLQPPFSMIKREVAGAQLPWCVAHGTGVICYSPMQSGILTDTFSAARVDAFAADDWRRRAPEFKSPNLERNLALRDALKPVARRHNTTVGAVAIAWILTWPGVTGAIVGARSAEQVDGWLPAARLSLDSHDLEAITAAIERSGAGTGPARRLDESVSR